MFTKRLFVSILLAAAATASVTACGDGDDECTGHLCAGDIALTDPEGGNIIFEYIYFDTELQGAFMLPAGVTTLNRVMGYFLNGHDPNRNPTPEPGACFNLVTNKGWPMYIAPGTTELDVGAVSIIGPNEAGTETTITLDKMPAGKDSIGRPHASFYQKLQPDAGKFIRKNQSYTVKLGGAGSVPATEFPDAIFMAEDYQVNNPGLEGNGPMNPAQDFTVGWTPVTSSNLPAGDTVLGVTWLVDFAGSPTHMCPVLHSAGTFTIPAATIAEYKAIAQARSLPVDKVILLRNAIVHKLARLPNGVDNNKRRIDMLSVMCWAQLMDVL